MDMPRIETERLRLRPFGEDDVPEVTRLAGDHAVADTTLNIPHPYITADARQWIARHEPGFQDGVLVTLAITSRDGALLGAISLTVRVLHRTAELGYWVGKEHWGSGYATEAARALVGYAFDVMELRRVHAHHLTRNPASGRVMEKIGMRREGVLRAHVEKWGEPEDIAVWGILRDEAGPA